MNYQVRHLKLFEPLNFSVKNKTQDFFSQNNEEELISFVNKVPAKSTNPNKKNFLTQKKYLGSKTNFSDKNVNQIKSAEYFFVQYFLTEEDSCDERKVLSLLEDLAEAIFLESLWQEITFYDDVIFVRKLKEENCSVFQLFIKINDLLEN